MGLRETFRESAASVRTAAEDTKNGVVALVFLSVLQLGVALLLLITGRQILKAVRADG
jgi:hypothetical protein